MNYVLHRFPIFDTKTQNDTSESVKSEEKCQKQVGDNKKRQTETSNEWNSR